MTPFSDNPVVPINNGLEGGLGVAMYLSSPGVDDQSRIEFRRVRTISTNRWLVLGTNWAPGSSAFLGDVVAAIVKSPTVEISAALAASYNSAVFWCQLRTHNDGIENDTIWRPRRVSIDSGGDVVALLEGTGRITEVRKLDGGGVLVEFEFYPAQGTTVLPITFALSAATGPTSPTAVSVSFVTGQTKYSLTLPTLQDAGVYGLEIHAVNSSDTLLIDSASFTADSSGPDMVQDLGVC